MLQYLANKYNIVFFIIVPGTGEHIWGFEATKNDAQAGTVPQKKMLKIMKNGLGAYKAYIRRV